MNMFLVRRTNLFRFSNKDVWIERTLAIALFVLAIIAAPVRILAQEPNAAYGKDKPLPDAPVRASFYHPPSAQDRFHQYLRDAFGPSAFIATAVMAGVDQSRNAPPEWKQGGTGFAKRFGSEFGESAIEETTRYALASAWHQDTKYYRCSCTGVFPRLGHALFSSVTARTLDGHRVVSFPNLIAPYAGGLVATRAWYPDRFGLKDGIRLGSVSFGNHVGFNVFHEFLPFMR